MIWLYLENTNMQIWVGREGYTSAEAALFHMNNIGNIDTLKYAELVEFQVQGPAEELEKLKEHLGEGPTYYPLSKGSLRSKRMW